MVVGSSLKTLLHKVVTVFSGRYRLVEGMQHFASYSCPISARYIHTIVPLNAQLKIEWVQYTNSKIRNMLRSLAINPLMYMQLMPGWLTHKISHRENSSVDLLLVLLPVKDHTTSWSSQRLVGGCGDNVRVLKWTEHDTRCHQTRDVCHICH